MYKIELRSLGPILIKKFRDILPTSPGNILEYTIPKFKPYQTKPNHAIAHNALFIVMHAHIIPLFQYREGALESVKDTELNNDDEPEMFKRAPFWRRRRRRRRRRGRRCKYYRYILGM